MAFQRLTRPEVRALHNSSGRGTQDEYVAFLQDIAVGSGGKVNVAAAKVGRQTVKNRLTSAAVQLGKETKFLRSREETVVFEVVG